MHEELEIAHAPADTPYALQILLDLVRTQYMQAIENMKNPSYRIHVQEQIDKEKVMFESVVSRGLNLLFGIHSVLYALFLWTGGK